jgi:alpha-galactosidase
MARLAKDIHTLGLKFGVYSTPWMVSYTGYPGGSADDPSGRWIAGEGNIVAGPPTPERGRYIGKHDFFANDVRQWSAWGVDYVKMDWNPNDVPHVKMMHDILRHCGRDIMLSLSNTAPIDHALAYMKYAQSWRTTGDIWDSWTDPDTSGHATISEIGFNQERWAPYAGPGHFPDADMFAVGWVSYWRKVRYSRLSPDEQYSHVSLWSILASPMILGMDLERLDPFTTALFSNPEVNDVNQDSLGVQGVRMATLGAVDVYVKPLDDGSKAVGFFNRDDGPVKTRFNKFRTIGLSDAQDVRDLWRQKDLGRTDGFLDLDLPAHGVLLTKMRGAK